MKLLSLVMVCVLLAAAVRPCCASDVTQEAEAEKLSKLLANFERYAVKAMADWHVPGMAIVIVRGDDVLYEKAFGVRELGKDDPVTTDTVFQIGSTSKAFTAALVATLVDEGKLKWDDKVVQHFGEFRMYDPWVTKEFMVLDLMAQRSGMAPHAIDTLIMTGFGRDRVIDSLRYVKPATSFRSAFAYQNNLWLVAARIVENITGETWERNIKERIFRPLGMTSSSTGMKSYTKGENVASLHHDVDGTIVVLPMDWPHIRWTYAYGPAGGINSNIKDVSKWLRMQAQNGVYKGNRIIKEENVKFMHAPKTPAGLTPAAPGPEQYYCLGWIHREANPYPITWHNGGTSGSKTMIAFMPDSKLGIAVLSNLIESNLPEALAWKFFDMYYGNPKRDWSKEALEAAKKAQEKAQAETPRQPEVPAPAMTLDKYAGEYSNEIAGKVNIAKSESKLVLTIGPDKVRIDLRPWDGNVFMGSWDFYVAREDVGPVTFSVDPDGNATGVTVDVFNADGCGVFRKASAAGAPAARTASRDKVVIDGMNVTRERTEASEPTVERSVPDEFDTLFKNAVSANGVKPITYEQLQRLRSSKAAFVLVDCLSSDDYSTGHIPGAVSFPVKNINFYNSVNKIPMGSNIVVYCLDNHCPYSEEAARKLTGYGYRVLVYKGGLDEWQQKGNALQR